MNKPIRPKWLDQPKYMEYFQAVTPVVLYLVVVFLTVVAIWPK